MHCRERALYSITSLSIARMTGGVGSMLPPRVNDLRMLTKPAPADLVFPDELSVCYTFMCRPAL